MQLYLVKIKNTRTGMVHSHGVKAYGVHEAEYIAKMNAKRHEQVLEVVEL